MQNFKKLMEQAKKMQSEIDRIQKELSQDRFEGEAGGGMVKAVLDGAFTPVSLKIEKEIIDPNDAEMLEDLIVAAFCAAQTKAKIAAQEKMKNVTGPFDIPGSFA